MIKFRFGVYAFQDPPICSKTHLLVIEEHGKSTRQEYLYFLHTFPIRSWGNPIREMGG
jgi:hypothetical protein